MPRKVPRQYSGYDWATSEAYADSTAHYSDFTRPPSSGDRPLEHNPHSRDSDIIATPNATGPCVISNSTDHVRPFYLLPQQTDHHMLSKLEYGLGLPWGSLNVNSRSNILTLSDELYDSFTNGSSILLPQRRVYELLRENSRKSVVELLNEPTYDYTLLSIDKTLSIRRRVNVAGTTTVEEYKYPISSFPIITSYVHPVFVICSNARLLTLDIMSQYLTTYEMHCRSLSNTMELFWCGWSRLIPQKSVFYTCPASPSSQNDLDGLVSYRADRASFEHSLCHALKGETCLDEEAIRRFLGKRHRRGVRKRREKFIRAWVSIVSEEEFPTGPIPESGLSGETEGL